MQKFDILIVGGGMVGLTLALAIRKQSDLTVAIVDHQPMSPLTDEPELRVSAINTVNQQLFENLGVWSAITQERIQPYQKMHVWDKAGFGQLDFDLNDVSQVQQDSLGAIIENKVIRNALWKKAEEDQGIVFFTQEKLTNIAIGDNEVFASFAQQQPILAKLVVGADGANSWLREQMKISLTFRDYDHHAIVATVKCAQGHQNTAWQVFLETGPLALLPLSKQDHCSIVWSTSPSEAKRLNTLSKEEFSKEITAASDGKLGVVTLESELMTFPLRMRFAQDFVKDRIVLVGDAAHTIHPLAGQGVNLGLLDAAALAQELTSNITSSPDVNADDWLSRKALARYERWRKTEASEMIASMEVIYQSFKPQAAPIKFLRGVGMSLINEFTPVKKLFINHALGFKGQLPELAQKK